MNANKPYIIGLTGGIASGKSTVSAHLASLGVRIVDADRIAHEQMLAGGAAVEEIRAVFGDSVILPDGGVDRKALGRIVFADEGLRRRLESITHPLVQRTMLEEIGMARENGEPLVILDVPLLFEAGMDVLCSETWVVYARPETQLKRMMLRDGLNTDAAQRRIDAQMPLEEKLSRATLAIENEKSEEHLKNEVTKLYHAALRRAERENA